MGLFSGSKSNSTTTSFSDASQTVGPSDFEGVGASVREGNININNLAGGSYDFARSVVDESVNLAESSLNFADNSLYEVLGLADASVGSSLEFAGGVVSDSGRLVGDTVSESLSFSSNAVGESLAFAGNQSYDTFNLIGNVIDTLASAFGVANEGLIQGSKEAQRNVLDASAYAIEAAEETTDERLTKTVVIAAAVVGVAMFWFNR